jgi:hypothetical protein
VGKANRIGNVAQLLVPTRPGIHLVNGGTLELEMGPDPNKKWGADDVPGMQVFINR